MKPIKVEFHRHDNFVCGRVLDMPEELKGQGTIIEGINYEIASRDYPALNNDMLFLRGEDTIRDDEWFQFEYWSEQRAKTAVKAYRDLIDKWNEKHKEILDDVEKEYLAVVIKPFKNRVKCIKKMIVSLDANEECIAVYLNDHDLFHLPNFKRGKMYNGMEANREYTLKELGLE